MAGTALTTSLAGADSAARVDSADVPTGLIAPAAAVSAARKTLSATPVHAATSAPAGHGVISGLAADGIPTVALNAYRVAASRLADAQPSCGLRWYLLAAIGRAESDHGRLHGAVLHADGYSTPRIIGPALDGVHWAYVKAPSDGRALDGDAVYAHALGPMQFIPTTWALYRADGDGDGKADVFDINDAALGAARYLCAAGGDLHLRANQEKALFAYNHTDEYVAQVLALAAAYDGNVHVSGKPVGATTGPLPSPKHSGPVPPASPAAPPAGSGVVAQAPSTTAAPTSPTSRPTHVHTSPSTTPVSTPTDDPPPSSTTDEPPASSVSDDPVSSSSSGVDETTTDEPPDPSDTAAAVGAAEMTAAR